MRSVVKNYLGMIAVAVVAVLVIGAIGVRIDRDQQVAPAPGIEATPAISGNAPSGLVDVHWLQQYQTQVDYIFDLSDPRQYEAGHIPGAIHIWWQDAMGINAINYAEPYTISEPDNPDSVFGNLTLNVPQNARIVLYDNQNSERASWMLWVMHLNGYTDVHVLDGGLPAWIGADGELVTAVEDNRSTDITATPTWNEEITIRREPLRDRLEDGDIQIIDTRSSDEQLDDVNETIRLGHIPESINIPTSEVMRRDGTFKSPEELQEVFESHGITPEQDIVVYSLFTSQSGNVWLALQLAGYDNVMIYQEGYVGWAQDESLPIETEPYPTAESIATPLVSTPIATPADSTPAATPEPEATTSPEPESTPDEDGPTDLTGI